MAILGQSQYNPVTSVKDVATDNFSKRYPAVGQPKQVLIDDYNRMLIDKIGALKPPAAPVRPVINPVVRPNPKPYLPAPFPVGETKFPAPNFPGGISRPTLPQLPTPPDRPVAPAPYPPGKQIKPPTDYVRQNDWGNMTPNQIIQAKKMLDSGYVQLPDGPYMQGDYKMGSVVTIGNRRFGIPNNNKKTVMPSKRPVVRPPVNPIYQNPYLSEFYKKFR